MCKFSARLGAWRGRGSVFSIFAFFAKSRVSGIFRAQDGSGFCISGSIRPTETVHPILEREKYFMKIGHAPGGRGPQLWAWQMNFDPKWQVFLAQNIEFDFWGRGTLIGGRGQLIEPYATPPSGRGHRLWAWLMNFDPK